MTSVTGSYDGGNATSHHRSSSYQGCQGDATKRSTTSTCIQERKKGSTYTWSSSSSSPITINNEQRMPRSSRLGGS